MIYPPSVSDHWPPPNIPIRTNQTLSGEWFLPSFLLLSSTLLQWTKHSLNCNATKNLRMTFKNKANTNWIRQTLPQTCFHHFHCYCPYKSIKWLIENITKMKKAKMKRMTMLMPSWASVLFSTSFNVGHSCRLNYTFREHKSKMLHILPKQEPQKKKKSVFLVRKKIIKGGTYFWF